MKQAFIGDVHGCADELAELLQCLPKRDVIVQVGDLIAKGPDSKRCIEIARENDVQVTMGNHESHVLECASGRKERTHPNHQALAETLSKDELAYLKSLPLYRRLPGDVLVVHAGLVPGVALEDQRRKDLLTIRTIRPDGSASKRSSDGVAWTSQWNGPEHVVFGHDAPKGLQEHPHATGLDTGCVYGGRLTALLLPERRFISVEAKRTYLEPKGG